MLMIKKLMLKNIMSLKISKIRGNIEPINWDPTSPIIILAGLVFHHKKPRQEPAIEEIKTANSTEINTGFIKLE